MARTVLQFIDNLGLGGKERQCVELLKELSRTPSYDNYVVVMSREIFYREVYSLPRVRLSFMIRRTTHDPTIFFQFFNLCRAIRPDVITVWDSMTAVYALPVAKLLGIQYVTAMIQDAPDAVPKKVRWRAKLVFPFADAVVANSQAGLLAYGMQSQKARVIHSGYDLSSLTEMSDPVQVKRHLQIPHPLVVGMVASFTHYKDQLTFIRAAQQIIAQRRDVVFVMVGMGPSLPVCQEAVAEHEQPYIRFLGRVEGPIEGIVSMFDIGVLATFTEGISNSIMEYMILGKPVVATDGGGTKELVLDGVTGYLVQPRDPGELAEKVTFLLNDSALRLRMGSLGKQRILQQFLMEHTTAQFCQLYDELYHRDKRNTLAKGTPLASGGD